MKVWIRQFDAPQIGGPLSFTSALIPWLRSQGAHVTGDHTERAIDVALAIATIETPELRTFKWRNVPIVQRLDNIPFRTPGSDFAHQSARIRRCYEIADAVVFQSEHARRTVVSAFGEPGCHWCIIHNGVDLEMFRPSGSAWTSGPLTLAAISIWRPHKRLSATIRGFLAFRERAQDSRLFIVGDIDRVKNERVSHPAITYTGQLTREELARLLPSCHVLLHLAWLDCCPNIVLEAQAAGAVVICTNGGGTKELILNESGIVLETDPPHPPPPTTNIYDPHVIPDVPPEEVARAIEKIAEEMESRRARLLAAREWLGIGRAGKAYLDLFRKLISGEIPRPWRRSFWPLAARALLRRAKRMSLA